MVAALYGFAAFFYVLGLTLPRVGLFAAYSGALIVTAVIQALITRRSFR